MAHPSPYELLQKVNVEKAIKRRDSADRWSAIQSQTIGQKPLVQDAAGQTQPVPAPASPNTLAAQQPGAQASQHPEDTLPPLVSQRHAMYDAVIDRHNRARQTTPALKRWEE